MTLSQLIHKYAGSVHRNVVFHSLTLVDRANGDLLRAASELAHWRPILFHSQGLKELKLVYDAREQITLPNNDGEKQAIFERCRSQCEESHKKSYLRKFGESVIYR